MVNDIVCLPLAMSGDKLQCVLRRISTILCIYCLILSEDAEADSLQKLLQYATGAIEIPVMGFPKTPTVYFRHLTGEWNPSWDYPVASTCAFSLGLPIVQDYGSFRSRMTEALSVEGFTMA